MQHVSSSPDRPRARPPVKIQGGKARLIPFLRENLDYDPQTQRWVEPFLGAGAVLLNVMPERALVGDANPHIVELYRALQDDVIAPAEIAENLRRESEMLRSRGETHFYEVRERFNRSPSPSDFVFLNHTCFNGLMRFNRNGEFNSPFCRNPERLKASLIDDITARLAHVQAASRSRDWTFEHQDWRRTLAEVSGDDFVYADPPYAGRHTTYYQGWSEQDASELAREMRRLSCRWAVSDWAADASGPNPRLKQLYPGLRVRTQSHRYVVGAQGRSRGRMTEALVLSPSAPSERIELPATSVTATDKRRGSELPALTSAPGL